jgi:hypothetical protein
MGELRAVAIPPDAVAAFRRYRGDAESAWENEDESAAAMIRHYGAAIEAQAIAFRTITSAEMPIEPPGA